MTVALLVGLRIFLVEPRREMDKPGRNDESRRMVAIDGARRAVAVAVAAAVVTRDEVERAKTDASLEKTNHPNHPPKKRRLRPLQPLPRPPQRLLRPNPNLLPTSLPS